jgi:RNA polymerase-binding transcription factor DksA
MTYTTRLSTTRRKPLAVPSRPATLARSLARLEREHVALLLALSELEATVGAPTTDGALRAALAPLLRGDLRSTQYALRRADAGLYGVCDGCGRSIAARRLELNPASTRCSACEAHARTWPR